VTPKASKWTPKASKVTPQDLKHDPPASKMIESKMIESALNWSGGICEAIRIKITERKLMKCY
jgi:hypothetical protein